MCLGFLLFTGPITAQEKNRQNDTASETETADIGGSSDINEEDLVFGDGNSEGNEASGAESGGLSPFGVWDVIRMILVLGAVVALIYGVMHVLKRFSGQKSIQSSLINIIASRPLQGSKALHIVQIGKQYFLIASGDNEISLLSEITEKETIDNLEVELEKAEEQGSTNFQDIFRKAIGGKKHSSNEEADMDDSAVFVKKQRERIKKL